MYSFGFWPLYIAQTGNHPFAGGGVSEVALLGAQSFESVFYRPVDDTGNNVVSHGRPLSPANICVDFPTLSAVRHGCRLLSAPFGDDFDHPPIGEEIVDDLATTLHPFGNDSSAA